MGAGEAWVDRDREILLHCPFCIRHFAYSILWSIFKWDIISYIENAECLSSVEIPNPRGRIYNDFPPNLT